MPVGDLLQAIGNSRNHRRLEQFALAHRHHQVHRAFFKLDRTQLEDVDHQSPE
jgi:hypothetical protein